MAEGILQHKADEAALNWTVDSAGTSNYHIGSPPHHLAQKVAKMHGIDISRQRGRQFKKEDMLVFDRIYVMDNAIYEEVKRTSRELWDAKKTELIMNELYPGEDIDVPDPWFGTEEGFHEVYEMLDMACEKIVNPNP